MCNRVDNKRVVAEIVRVVILEHDLSDSRLLMASRTDERSVSVTGVECCWAALFVMTVAQSGEPMERAASCIPCCECIGVRQWLECVDCAHPIHRHPHASI